MIPIKLTNAVVGASYQRRASSCLSYHCQARSAVLSECIPLNTGLGLFLSQAQHTPHGPECGGSLCAAPDLVDRCQYSFPLSLKDGLAPASERRFARTDCTFASSCVICGGFISPPSCEKISFVVSRCWKCSALVFGSALC